MSGFIKQFDNKGIKVKFILIFLFLIPFVSFSQIDSSNVVKTIIAKSQVDTTMVADTTKVVESAPLDIGSTRGIFIITPDKKMQMRILGSVRFLVDFDNVILENKNSFETYEIPTGSENVQQPNYYNGLTQTRLGFEVTRKTDAGDVFIRLETDFAGSDGFRIRHAYGQYKTLLVGQTWSLFSQVTALPGTVDFGGPPGAVTLRTPQIRFFTPWKVLNTNLNVAFEYVVPDLNLPDSLEITSFQFFPAMSAQISKNYNWGYLQISAIVPFLSARNTQDSVIFKTGWGISSSVIINSWKQGKWYFQATGGKAITPFINNLGGTGLSLITSPDGQGYLPFSFGGFATYEHNFSEKVYSNLTYGLVTVQQKSYTPENTFNFGYALMFNTFWNIVEGAKIGGELVWGRRKDKDRDAGNAGRLNFLFYYDF